MNLTKTQQKEFETYRFVWVFAKLFCTQYFLFFYHFRNLHVNIQYKADQVNMGLSNM